ncbi:MAG: pyridoxal phosphate-dependent aminotransferase [Paracoccaceae bacterium]
MKVEIHKLFEYLLQTAGADPPECFLGFSMADPPELGAYLPDLDPRLKLDWNGVSFQGLPSLRARVIDQAGLSTRCSPDDVLITAGTAEANYLIFRQLLSAGDEIITDSPGWPQAGVMARAIGAQLVAVPRREADGWALDPAAIAAAITPRTKLVFLTNPNNPTGRLIPAADLQAIASACDRAGVWLLVDEVYAGLEWAGPRPPSVAGIYARGITTGSVSKALGLQGIRTGWLITPDKALLRDALILRENASEIMNILGEHIAEIALRPDRLAATLTTTRAEVRQTLARLDGFIAATPRLSWQKPQAGLIGLARLKGIDSDELAKRLLAAPYRTFVLPGSAYGQPHHIRLGVGGGMAARLDEGLTRLADCLASLPNL